jgi:predicted house-cleaning noncanonical NTP pyrophosphatase (MazG superfamily)
MWSIQITRGRNGYRLRWHEELENGSLGWQEEYIQDDEMDGLKSGEELLWRIMDYFGFGGSKHDSVRLRVEREKQ